MPNIESHFLILLNYLLSQERSHFFESFDAQSEQALQALITAPSILHVNAIKLSNLPITRNLQEGKYMDKKMGGRTMQIRNEFRSI